MKIFASNFRHRFIEGTVIEKMENYVIRDGKGSHDLLWKFWDSSIYPEWLKPEMSNLAHI